MTEYDDVIRLLREERPEATPLELDQVKQRVRQRAALEPKRSQDMKSRLAILLMLVLGLMLSTTGAGLAIQDFATDDASMEQYPPEDNGDVLGEDDGDSPPAEVVPDTDEGQPIAQVESGSDGELAFTGFLAIPVLIGGVALLSGGLLLRRRTRGDDDS